MRESRRLQKNTYDVLVNRVKPRRRRPARNPFYTPPKQVNYEHVIHDLFAAQLNERPIILTGGPWFRHDNLTKELSALGVKKILVIANSTIDPRKPNLDSRVQIVEGPQIPETEDALVLWMIWRDYLANPPEEMREIVQAFDPDGEAFVFVETSVPFTGRAFGRETLGGRSADALALEHKPVANTLFDEIGIQTVPTVLVGVDDVEKIRDAAKSIDQGHGTVWSVDKLSGPQAGGRGTLFVPTGQKPKHLRNKLRDAHLIRIMPYIDGVSCSIYAFISKDGEIAIGRPMEQITYLRNGKFAYAGSSSFWHGGSDLTVRQMKSSIRTLAEWARDEYQYCGLIGIDGVAPHDVTSGIGFVPNEITSRVGDTFKLYAHASGFLYPETATYMLHLDHGIDFNLQRYVDRISTGTFRRPTASLIAYVKHVPVGIQVVDQIDIRADRYKIAPGREIPTNGVIAMIPIAKNKGAVILEIATIDEKGVSIGGHAEQAFKWATDEFGIKHGDLAISSRFHP